MTFRTLAAPMALAVLVMLLPGCGAMKFSSSPPAAQDSVATGNAAFERKDFAVACRDLSLAGPAAGVEVLNRAGEACAKDGQQKAQQAYQAALTASPGDTAAMEGLGMAALCAGDLARARDLLTAAAKAGGKDPRAALALGDVSLLSGQCDRALAAYHDALRRDASFSPARARLEAVRLVCGANKAAAVSGAPSRAASPSSAGRPESPSATSPAAGSAKETGKPKAAPKTIDLNDI